MSEAQLQAYIDKLIKDHAPEGCEFYIARCTESDVPAFCIGDKIPYAFYKYLDSSTDKDIWRIACRVYVGHFEQRIHARNMGKVKRLNASVSKWAWVDAERVICDGEEPSE